jgi:oligosaccharide repeat unit polymerase
MSNFLFWLLVVQTVVLLGHGLIRPARFFEFPYFAAAVFAIFVLPQLVALNLALDAVDPDGFEALLLMCNLCLACAWLGYALPLRTRETQARDVAGSKLMILATIFTVVAYGCHAAISRMTEDDTGGDQWTGRVTIYAFFATLAFPAFNLFLLQTLRRASGVAVAGLLAAGVIPVYVTVFHGRREAAITLFASIALMLFFYRGWKPARVLVVAALVFATLAAPFTGIYRTVAKHGAWEVLPHISMIDVFRDYIEAASTLELRNAAMIIQARSQSGTYEYFAPYWDILVFRFLPAQIFGRELKEDLMSTTTEEKRVFLEQQLMYDVPGGTTPTGMGEAFEQFWYFGALLFALISRFYKRFWRLAAEGSLVGRLIYCQTFSAGVLVITHSTVILVPILVYNAMFVALPLILLSTKDTVAPNVAERSTDKTSSYSTKP